MKQVQTPLEMVLEVATNLGSTLGSCSRICKEVSMLMRYCALGYPLPGGSCVDRAQS